MTDCAGRHYERLLGEHSEVRLLCCTGCDVRTVIMDERGIDVTIDPTDTDLDIIRKIIDHRVEQTYR